MRRLASELQSSFCVESGQIKSYAEPNDIFQHMLEEIIRVTPLVSVEIGKHCKTLGGMMEIFDIHGPEALAGIKGCGIAMSRRIHRLFNSVSAAHPSE